MQEWWVNINRNGGSTWAGIYTSTKATISTAADQTTNILKNMGIKIPSKISLDELSNVIKNTPKLSSNQIEEFYKEPVKLKKKTTEDIEIHVCGLLPKGLIEKYESTLCFTDNGNEVLMFCDYSNFDIPISYVFDVVKDLRNRQLFSSKIKLKMVSQEFNLRFDSIPKGHKTICNFQFVDANAKDLILSLPHISDWYESTKILELT